MFNQKSKSISRMLKSKLELSLDYPTKEELVNQVGVEHGASIGLVGTGLVHMGHV